MTTSFTLNGHLFKRSWFFVHSAFLFLNSTSSRWRECKQNIFPTYNVHHRIHHSSFLILIFNIERTTFHHNYHLVILKVFLREIIIGFAPLALFNYHLSGVSMIHRHAMITGSTDKIISDFISKGGIDRISSLFSIHIYTRLLFNLIITKLGFCYWSQETKNIIEHNRNEPFSWRHLHQLQ